MGSISTIYNGIRTKLAGRALMDVAFSDRSTNGVQNKIIKAKFDGVDNAISKLNSDIKASYQFRSTRSIVLATADGTKTVSQLLAEAKTALQALTPQYTHCKILFFQIPTGNNTASVTLFLFESAIDLFSDFSSKNIVGYGIRGESNSTTTYYVSTAGTEIVIVNSLIRSSGNTIADMTSRVPSNGTKLSVQIEDYERIS